jgi:RNA polymerase sigma factor (sigma-70 family)
MRDDPVVAALVLRAAGHDQDAWNALVERYSPMVWAICTRYRLSSHDTEDVNQNVWLRLVEHLGNLREPAALPGWLATTASRECLGVLRAQRRHDRFGQEPEEPPQSLDAAAIEEEIIAAERNAAVRAAFAELPAHCRQLLAMLIGDPPQSYAKISVILGIPQGSIGPQRARCLERMRRSDSLRAFLDGDTTGTPAECSGGEPRA